MNLKTEKQPALFAKYIFINDILPLSEDTKKFLQKKNIKNLWDLSIINPSEFDSVYERNIREEIKRFHRNLLSITGKKEVWVKFSKNISAPKTVFTREEENMLIALLIYESLLGKKRQVKKIKHHYLPNLYLNLKKIKPRRLNRNAKLFRIQYFYTAS